MRGKAIILLTLASLLAGCAAPIKLIWEKPDVTQQEFNQDIYECTQETSTSWSGGGTGSAGLIMMAGARSQAQQQANNMFKLCMRGRGYADHVAKEDE